MGTLLPLRTPTQFYLLTLPLLAHSFIPPAPASLAIRSTHIRRMTGRPYRIHDIMLALQRLEAAGFMMYASEMVCAKCSAQAELAFVNTSWVREMLSLDT